MSVNEEETADIEFRLWFREPANEWVSEFTIKYLNQHKTFRVTGCTQQEARNAGFACIGYGLMGCVWDLDELETAQ